MTKRESLAKEYANRFYNNSNKFVVRMRKTEIDYLAGYEQAIQDVLVAIEDAVNYCNCTGEIQNLIKEEK